MENVSFQPLGSIVTLLIWLHLTSFSGQSKFYSEFSDDSLLRFYLTSFPSHIKPQVSKASNGGEGSADFLAAL